MDNADRSRSRRVASVRSVISVGVVLVLGLVVLVAGWLSDGGTQRNAVQVQVAQLLFPDRLRLFVDSCNGDPEVTRVVETAVTVQVRVVAFPHPPSGGEDCRDAVHIQLQDPLGDRALVDLHSEKFVGIIDPRPRSRVTGFPVTLP